MEAINIRYFAYLYYDEVKPGKYSWDNSNDRIVCRANFVKLVSRDGDAMKRALSRYIEAVKSEAMKLD